MDEEQGSYQAEEVIEQEQTESTETVTTQEEVAPTGHRVKYNGEEKLVSYDEAPTWIQKGMNYDKVSERAQQLESQTKYLEKMARIEGYGSVDEYVKAIDAYEQNQRIQQEAQRMNIDPEAYEQYFQPVNQQLNELQQKVQTYEQQATAQQQQEQTKQAWGELYSTHPNLVESSASFNDGKNPDWYSPQMQELVGMGYKPVHAYELANKETLFKQKEQETLARLTGRDAKQVLSSIDSPNTMTLNPADMTNAEIQAISERVRRGERITL